jgi:hypothetical protein
MMKGGQMAPTSRVSGTLPEVIRNTKQLYDGDLAVYLRIIFNQAQNLYLPYHNFRHMMNVVHLCYQACIFYSGTLSPKQMRNLLIAALFHDFDHSGSAGDDHLNIDRAVRSLEEHILPEDGACLGEIAALIRATEYPYMLESKNLTLSAQILRDADISQGIDAVWIQQVVFGLAAEWAKAPIEVLGMQSEFYGRLKFETAWARQLYPQNVIDAKIVEARQLLEILQPVTVRGLAPPKRPSRC